jgi:hypothetical protein
MEVSGQLHAAAALPSDLPPPRHRYSLSRKLNGPAAMAGRFGEEINMFPCRESNKQFTFVQARERLLVFNPS